MFGSLAKRLAENRGGRPAFSRASRRASVDPPTNNPAMVAAAWKSLVHNRPPDPGSLGCTVALADSWLM
ncbi:hypothetical protein [Streptomyces mirabilis]|uniref:hypothetical protein n=1 Tax=Streptomyces mirabilis TaxID=68239 RepID=UPI0038037385